MLRKMFPFLLVTAFILSISGCTSPNVSTYDTTGSTPAAETETPSTAAPVAETETASDSTPQPVAVTFNESPILKAKVDSGELPPVDQRLPKNPAVGITDAKDIDGFTLEVGKYGGTLRLIDYQQGAWGHDIGWIANKDTFFVECPGLNFDGSAAEPNLVESFEVSPDAKVFTFKFREGTKWSDGVELTTDDVKFWYDDILMNTELTQAVPANLCSGGKAGATPIKLEVIDQYTFKLISETPYAGFLPLFDYNMSIIQPAHFLKKYHVKYADSAFLAAEIKKQGFEENEWFRLFGYASNRENQDVTGLPCLTAYICTSKTATELTFERNPYYFRVDSAGNQLPYIDKVVQYVVNDTEAATLKIINGEVDLARRAVLATNLPLYVENADAKGYAVKLYKQHASLAEVFLNHTSKDPVWNEVINNIKFKQAFSMAIDRQSLIDKVYLGQAGLPRIIPINTFDLAQANALLDEIGMNEKDADGYRLYKGKRFEVPFAVGTYTGEEAKTIETITQMLKDVGLYVTMKTYDNSVWEQMAAANEVKAFPWWLHYPRWPWHEAADYRGMGWQYTYCPLWFQYMDTNGKKGTEPPAEYKELWTIWGQMNATADPVEQNNLWEQMKANCTKNIWWIPMIDDVINPMIVNKNIGNVPETGYAIEVASTFPVVMYFK